MDACCATLKSTSHLGNVGKSVFCSKDNGFWGEKIGGSRDNFVRAYQCRKKLNLERRGRKIKPGVAYSVLTRDNINQTVVSISSSQSSLSLCVC